jgi:hypothetical protein
MKATLINSVILVSVALGLSLQPSVARAEEGAAPPAATAEKPADAGSAAPAAPAADAGSAAPAAPAADAKKSFVCEKCQVTKDAPGKCEKCGADLVEKPAAADEPKKDEPKKDDTKKEEAPK